MIKLCRGLLSVLLLIAFSSPVWAHSNSYEKQKRLKKTAYQLYLRYKQERKTARQYREILKVYNRIGEDARQKFLAHVGSDLPDATAEIQKIKDAYEQQITELNNTITSYQQQLAGMQAGCQQQLADMEAVYQQQLTDMEAACQLQLADMGTSCQQQITELTAAHQTALDDLSADCNTRTEAAYDEGLAAGSETCSNNSPAAAPQLIGSWSTANFTPSAVTVNGSGNVFVLDTDLKTVLQYDGGGAQIGQWSSPMLRVPVDLALNSQGDVFILNEESPYPVQKYGSDGMPYDWTSALGTLTDPKGLFIDGQDTIYVTDMGGTYGSRIRVFNTSGQLLHTFGEVQELDGEVYYDVAVDKQNHNFYVLTGSKVAVFDPDENFLYAWQGNFTEPSGLAVGSQGEVFVADKINHEIYHYDAGGNLISTFAAGDLQNPGRLALDDQGRLYIGDYADQMIRIYQ